jgi:hypothetical protein
LCGEKKEEKLQRKNAGHRVASTASTALCFWSLLLFYPAEVSRFSIIIVYRWAAYTTLLNTGGQILGAGL